MDLSLAEAAQRTPPWRTLAYPGALEGTSKTSEDTPRHPAGSFN